MQTKNLITFLLLVGLSNPLWSQVVPTVSLTKRAQLSYEQFSYSEALELYLEAFKRDSSNVDVAHQIASCYIKLNDSENAEPWLRLVLDQVATDNDDVEFQLAEQLSKNKKYAEAAVWYAKASSNPLVPEKLKGLADLERLSQGSYAYKVELLDFNTEDSEFGPFFYEGGLAFVSARKKQSWVKNEYSWDKSDYLDFYQFIPNDSVKRLHRIEGLNSKYHEGPADLFNEGSRIVFTRSNVKNSRLQKDPEGVTNLQLFFSDRDSSGKWMPPEAFDHNDVKFSSGHPTISDDGKYLIFASNQPGTYGGTDLFLSVWDVKSGWSRPLNLGTLVNTQGNEMFPFLQGDRLYFASNGWEGLGGLDLYEVSFDRGQVVGTARNLGAPLNSSQDDFGLIGDAGLRSGYFASSRAGSDDIYSFSRSSFSVSGHVRDLSSGAPLSSVQVSLHGDNGDGLEATTDSLGNFRLMVNSPGTYEIKASKSSFKQLAPASVVIEADGAQAGTIELAQARLQVRVLEEADSAEVDQVLLMLERLKDGQKVPNLPGDDHNFLIEPGEDYLLMIAKDGYFTKRDTIAATKLDWGTNVEEVRLKKVVIGESIRLDHIYYDVNSAHLRPESEVELDKLVLFMSDNSHLEIELSSHTDSRGSGAYNMNLSQQRAESAAKYLVDQGIDEDRIVPKGYGEAKLINRCADGVKCSDEEHQANRRTELKILKIE